MSKWYQNITGLSSTIPEMNSRRLDFGMCSLAGCIFVAGGYQNDLGVLDKCEIYSFESREWTEAAGMNTKRSGFNLIFFENKIWAIGGYSSINKNLDTIETYDLVENRWTSINVRLQMRRSCYGAAVHKNKIFVVGGITHGETLSSVEVYLFF